MIFFLDENFPRSAGRILEEAGHAVFDIRGTKNEGMTDAAIFNLAQQRNAVFLTTDRDFYHTIPWMHTTHHGVVVINL